MKVSDRLLLDNKAWAADMTEGDSEFFKRMKDVQTPEVLWIGCSDSRVPSEIIVGAQPGEIFVHRNIANQFITTDFNALSALQYSIDVLKVKEVIICGHYNCGGVCAALEKQSSKMLMVNKWLKHVKDIYRMHEKEIFQIENKRDKINRLVELNVIEQVYNLAHTSIIQTQWKTNNSPTLHGWVYGLDDGIIKELITLPPGSQINPIYEYLDI